MTPQETSNCQPPVAPPAATHPKSFQEMLLAKFPDFDPTWNDETKTKWFSNFETFMASAKKSEAGQ
jgi:hypothetical protein